MVLVHLEKLEMNPKDLQRFLSKVEKSNTCWNWIGAKTTVGYGQFRFQRKTIYSHRISYEIFKGDIPIGLQIDHLCRNPSCVNPEHLEAVTMKENILRGYSIQALNARKTHCKHGHPLDGNNLYHNTKGHRECRLCKCLGMRKLRSSKQSET